MKKTETVLKVPPVSLSLDTADAIIAIMRDVAAPRVQLEYEERLKNVFRNERHIARQVKPEANTEEDFVQLCRTDAEIKKALNVPTFERFTFLSPTTNVEFDNSTFLIAEVPKDLSLIDARVDGDNRFIHIQMRTNFKDLNEVRNWQLNQIIIQGADPNWVHGIHNQLSTLIQSDSSRTRRLVYRNALKLFWLSIILLLFSEYRIARLLYPEFNLQAPLSGTGVLVMFAVLLASVIVFAEVAISLYPYWFPYFEIENNLSKTRVSSRTFVATIFTGMYAAAILNLLALVLGPVFSRWIK